MANLMRYEKVIDESALKEEFRGMTTVELLDMANRDLNFAYHSFNRRRDEVRAASDTRFAPNLHNRSFGLRDALEPLSESQAFLVDRFMNVETSLSFGLLSRTPYTQRGFFFRRRNARKDALSAADLRSYAERYDELAEYMVELINSKPMGNPKTTVAQRRATTAAERRVTVKDSADISHQGALTVDAAPGSTVNVYVSEAPIHHRESQ